MTKIELEQIKRFAEENFNRETDDPKRVIAEHEECAVVTPWIDRSGRFPLNDVDAVKEWGLVTVLDFVEKAKKMI